MERKGRPKSWWRTLLARWLRRSDPAADPPQAVDVRQPLPRKPPNRSGAVAVEEPDEE